MWDNATLVAMVAVKDAAAAKDFYGGTLGLKQTDENQGGVAYEVGGCRLFVYVSPDSAGTGKATCFTLEVDDVAKTAADLKAKGVAFESFDVPGAEKQGDVYVMGTFRAAWFKDPDGNVVGLGNKM